MKNKIIAVDFDGVLFTDGYPNVGEPIEKNIAKIKELKKDNKIILWTCREGEPLDLAVKACAEQGLYFDAINKNLEYLIASWDGNDCRKIGADYYIDDRNISISDLKKTEPNDPVNRPSHYTQGKIECIEYIEDKDFNFHLGNAVKYITRAGKKDPNKKVEDLKKALWYIKREIAKYEKV